MHLQINTHIKKKKKTMLRQSLLSKRVGIFQVPWEDTGWSNQLST